MNLNISSAVKNVKTVITANSPVLLVGTAVAGVVATGILAAKGGYNARGIIDEHQALMDESEQSRELTLQEKVQLTWLCFAPPVFTGASTIASVVGVHTIHTKRHAALAGLYAVTTTKLDDYTEKAEEMLGAKKTQALNDSVAQKQLDRHPEKFENAEVMMVSDGTELCYDEWSGRWFMGSVPRIEKAVNEINRRLIDEGDASLNDFYDALGLGPIAMGQTFGWSGAKIEPRFGSVTSPDGRPAISVWFQDNPKENLGVLR